MIYYLRLKNNLHLHWYKTYKCKITTNIYAKVITIGWKPKNENIQNVKQSMKPFMEMRTKFGNKLNGKRENP